VGDCGADYSWSGDAPSHEEEGIVPFGDEAVYDACMTKNMSVYSTVIGFFVVAFLIYGTSLRYDFVRWDDGLLIYENPIVRSITPHTVTAAFTSYDPELYIPLTLLSYQLNFAIGGADPFIYKLTNLLLHVANALFVLLFVFLLVRRKWVAFFCGLLFLVHPLHTEAVVWASARKDLLSTFFFLASLNAYLYFHETDEKKWYRWSIGFFFCALLAKIIAATLPVVLLLVGFLRHRERDKKMMIQTIPFFALSILFVIIALIGKAGVISSASEMTQAIMANKSIVFYLQKLFVPTHLSVLYPYTGDVTMMNPDFLFSFTIVCVLIAGGLFFAHRWRVATFGVAFFLVTLAPTFLNSSIDGDLYFASDRYAYISSIGVLLVFCSAVFEKRLWTIFNLPTMFNMQYSIPAVILTSIAVVFAFFSHAQAKVWKNSETLFRNVIDHYPLDAHRAHNNLGNVYRRQGNLELAVSEFQTAIAISPRPRTQSNLGAVYRKQGKILEALEAYRMAIELNPEDPEPYFGLGIVYAERGDSAQALTNYRKALEMDPTYAEVYNNMGSLYLNLGQRETAIAQYRKAIALDPYFPEASYNLGIALTKIGEEDQAISVYENILTLEPAFVAARINLGILYYNAERFRDSIAEFRAVLRHDPSNARAISALKQMGEL
jgi:protein O-mannosyl-transferase